MAASYEYSRNYYPAAPTILLGLSQSGGMEANIEITALLDTGADATMIPENILKMAGARFVQQHRMRGVVGEAVPVNLYLTAVHIADHTIHGIRAIAVPENSEAIVGRDVLNQLEITLNGPALELWIA